MEEQTICVAVFKHTWYNKQRLFVENEIKEWTKCENKSAGLRLVGDAVKREQWLKRDQKSRTEQMCVCEWLRDCGAD